MKETGILTIATGSNYIELAQNLACTLKKSAPSVPVSIITDKEPDEITGQLFDDVYEAPAGLHPFEIKAHLYELTPYKRTLYLDADTLFNHLKFSLTEILKSLENAEIAFSELAVLGKDNPKLPSVANVNLRHIWNDYLSDDGQYIALHSSALYWRKSNTARNFFKRAVKLYGTIPTPTKPFPDALAFSMAASQLGLRSQAKINLFSAEGSRCDEREILGYPLFTYPGNQHTAEHLRFYRAITNKAAEYVLGVTDRVFRK